MGFFVDIEQSTIMNRYLLFLLFIITTGFKISCQDLNQFNVERLKSTKNGLVVLGSWATANIAINPFLADRSTGSQRYFHEMNIYWNIVNLGISGLGILKISKTKPSEFDLSSTMREQIKLEKSLLFNSGLDLAYIATGLYMIERSRNAGGDDDRLKGFGRSLVLQGSFLFLFDLTFYISQNRRGKQLFGNLQNFTIAPGYIRMRF